MVRRTVSALSHARTELLLQSSTPVLEPSEVCPQNMEIITQPPEKVALQPLSVAKSVKPTSSKGKLSKCTDIVRRSKRLQSSEVEPMVEDLAPSQSESKGSPPARKRKSLAGFPSKERSDDGGKLDYLVELLEEQGNAIRELSSKVSESYVLNQSPFKPDDGYKSLYAESQKKIDALTEEKRELSQQLEIALIKEEASERRTEFAMDFLDKLKDLLVMSSFSRPTQQTALTQALCKDPTTSVKKSQR